jgi:hypothetical protein
MRLDRSDSETPHLLSMFAVRRALFAFAAGEELGRSLGRPLGKSLGNELGDELGYELGISLGKALGEGVSKTKPAGLVKGVEGVAPGNSGSTVPDGGFTPKQQALNTPLKSGQQIPTSPLHAGFCEHDWPPTAGTSVKLPSTSLGTTNSVVGSSVSDGATKAGVGAIGPKLPSSSDVAPPGSPPPVPPFAPPSVAPPAPVISSVGRSFGVTRLVSSSTFCSYGSVLLSWPSSSRYDDDEEDRPPEPW